MQVTSQSKPPDVVRYPIVGTITVGPALGDDHLHNEPDQLSVYHPRLAFTLIVE